MNLQAQPNTPTAENPEGRLNPRNWTAADFYAEALDMFDLNIDILRKESEPGTLYEYGVNVTGRKALVEAMQSQGFEFTPEFLKAMEWEYEHLPSVAEMLGDFYAGKEFRDE